MMSMGSLAHYMHDLTALGLNVRDFLQEGNEQLWVHAATRGPRGFVKWVVIEERAEGGDVLFQAAPRDPHFLDGFERVAEGGGVALYRARMTSRRQVQARTESQASKPNFRSRTRIPRQLLISVGRWSVELPVGTRDLSLLRSEPKWNVKFVVQPPRSILSPRKSSSSRPLPSAFC